MVAVNSDNSVFFELRSEIGAKAEEPPQDTSCALCLFRDFPSIKLKLLHMRLKVHFLSVEFILSRANWYFPLAKKLIGNAKMLSSLLIELIPHHCSPPASTKWRVSVHSAVKRVSSVRSGDGNCRPGSSRPYRLSVSRLKTMPESGDERPHYAPTFLPFSLSVEKPF